MSKVIEATLEELPSLIPFKIKVTPEESKKIQEYLFTKGFKWESHGQEINHIHKKYLFIHDDKLLLFGSIIDIFDDCNFKEVILKKFDFECKKDIYRYLLNDGKIENIFTGDTAYFLNDSLYVTGETGLLDKSSYKDWKVVKENKWYDNIPESGRLCWVGENANMLDLIVSYDYSFKCFVSNLGITYKKAVPLTNSEIKRYLV